LTVIEATATVNPCSWEFSAAPGLPDTGGLGIKNQEHKMIIALFAGSNPNLKSELGGTLTASPELPGSPGIPMNEFPKSPYPSFKRKTVRKF